VGSLASTALPELLAAVDLPVWRDGVASLRGRLGDVLATHGLRARPSDANWVLVEAPGLREALAPHGVVVRDCTSFGLAGVVRIAVPDEDGILRLDRALSAADIRRTTERRVVSAERTT
jgi:histidinol-phosphate/aromatic aminotransferase/cobyric acid decarboxylase-like protein